LARPVLAEESPTRLSKRISGSFDRSDLGDSGSRNPTRDGISRKKADQFIEDLMRDVEEYIAKKLLPALRSAITEQLGEPADSNWSMEIDDAEDLSGILCARHIMTPLLNTTASTIVQWESGKKRPSGMGRKLLQIAKAKGLQGLTVG
jgi:hypothetical protein